MKKKVLIIDDEAGFSQLLAMNLEQRGTYEVRVETSGLNSLQTAHYFKPDIILLDVLMPDVSGRAVAEKIAADPVLKGIPIIFLTATISREDVQDHGGMIGGHLTLAKPAGIDEVLECIEFKLGKAS